MDGRREGDEEEKGESVKDDGSRDKDGRGVTTAEEKNTTFNIR